MFIFHILRSLVRLAWWLLWLPITLLSRSFFLLLLAGIAALVYLARG